MDQFAGRQIGVEIGASSSVFIGQRPIGSSAGGSPDRNREIECVEPLPMRHRLAELALVNRANGGRVDGALCDPRGCAFKCIRNVPGVVRRHELADGG